MLKNIYLITIFLGIAVPQVADSYGINVTGNITIYPFEITFIFLFILYVMGSMIGKVKWQRGSLTVPLVMFLVVVISWTLWGMQLYGLRSALYDSKALFYYTLFFMGFGLIKTEKDIQALLKTALAATCMYSIVLSSEFITKAGPMWAARPEYMEYSSKLSSWNGLAITLLLPFMIILYFEKKDNQKNRLWGIYAILAIVSQIIILLISQSRLQLMAVILIWLLTFGVLLKIHNRKTEVMFWYTLSIMIVGAILTVHPYIEIYKSMAALSDLYADSSFQTRFLTGTMALQQIIDSPLLGYGFGGLMIESSKETANTVLDMTNFFIDYTWLTIVYKAGILGGITFLWIWLRSLKIIYGLNNAASVSIKYASLISFAAIVFISLFSAYLIKSHIIVFITALLVIFDRTHWLQGNTNNNKLI